MAVEVSLAGVGKKQFDLAEGKLHVPTVQDSFGISGGPGFSLLMDGKVISWDRTTGFTHKQFSDNMRLDVDLSPGGLGPRNAEMADDTTVEYLRACLTPLDGNKLLNGEGLECLENPLQPRLPLPEEVAKKLFHMRPDARDWLVSAADEPKAATAKELSNFVAHFVMHEPPGGSTEMYTAFRTCWLVDTPLDYISRYVPMGSTFQMARNASDTSGARDPIWKRLRPDFMCWVSGALLFKGEEKASGNQALDAVRELKEKMAAAWDAGLLPGVQTPCMLAYVAAGHELQFFCIKSSGGAGEPLVQPISRVMNLRVPVERARALTATFHVYRLMLGFAATLPPAVPFPLGQALQGGDSSVTLMQGFVRKVVKKFSEHHAAFTSFELLKDLYAAMLKPQHEGRIIRAHTPNYPVMHERDYIVHLQPVGEPISGPPSTEDELARAVQGALNGLSALHSEGFVHRDVRWPNLIRLPADGRWLLVDLEHAGRVDEDCSQPPYPLKHWKSDMLAGGRIYTTVSDLKMLAQQLLQSLPFALSMEGCDLRDRLSCGSMSADDALRHIWFASR